MSKEFKSPCKEEYASLRNEIMLRAGWHQDYAKHAITTSISIWVGSFALLTYFFNQIYFNVISFVLLFPVLVLLPLAFKTYENYVDIVNISTYLIKFHEKSISDNDGTFFSWETSHAALLNHLTKSKGKILKTMNLSNNELTFLSCISLILFLIFSIVGLINNFSILYMIFCIIAIMFATVSIYFINKISSYKCLWKLIETATDFWDNYYPV